MQIAAFNENRFTLGHSAMMINEGLPSMWSARSATARSLHDVRGHPGMAFKGGSDDVRSSLSYKLKRVLRIKASGCSAPTPCDRRS